MINSFKVLHYFASKNYSSTFKLRSRLAQFFKHVHPDQMNQAPTNIRQQNNRSLTNFNSYIDCVNNQKPIQGKLLKFYIAEKTNHKSKKFYSFSIELPEINQNEAEMSEEKVEKFVNNIVDALNRKFHESRTITDKKKKQKQKINIQTDIKDVENEESRIKRLAQDASIFKRETQYHQWAQDRLKNQLYSKYLESQKDHLAHHLKKNISFADTSTNKPMMWSRLAMNKAGLYKDYQEILDNLIDPRLIYFDQSLTMNQIDEFKEKMLPGSMDRGSYKASKIITQVCQKMESFDPPIFFYVSTFYSGNTIPGFFTIPYNFQASQLAKQYEKKIDEVISQRQKYEQFYDYYLEICQSLKRQNNIHVQSKNFKGNHDIWVAVLMLKRLKKYSFPNLIEVVGLDKESYDLFKLNYKVKTDKTAILYKNKVILLIEFQDKDIQEVVEQVQKITS